ncbi:MAG: outer membrane beta-barrel protein [Bacteroidetes bacterium]|nr:outer membrane beta-barrel protein [Bacteroidota bacterium]
MSKVLSKSFLVLILAVSAHLFISSGLYAQVDFVPEKKSSASKEKFFVNTIGQYQRTFGGDFKVLTSPFSYSPDISSMKKKPTYHFQVGASAGYHISKNLGMSIGAALSSKGQEYSDYRGTENDSMTGNKEVLYSFSKSTKLTYLTIPLQLHYNTSEDKENGFSCYIGIYYARLIKYTDYFFWEASNSYGSFNQSYTATGDSVHYYLNVSFPWYYGKADAKIKFTSRPFKQYDIGEMIGVGWQGKLYEKSLLVVMLNYEGGFIDVKNSDSDFLYNGKTNKYYNFLGKYDPNQFVSFKNSLIGISVGLKFKI